MFLSRIFGAKEAESMNLSILMLHLSLLLVIKKKLKYVEKLTIHCTQSRGEGDKSDQCDKKKHYQKFVDKYKPIVDRSLCVILQHSLL